VVAKAPLADDDGRRARSERTRTAIVEALLALLGEGILNPGADLLAERAGISRRAIFNHFRDLEDLFAAAADVQRTRLMGLVHPISPEGPLADRVAALVAQQARIMPLVAPVRRAAGHVAHTSAVVAARIAETYPLSRARIEATFSPELQALQGDARREQVASLASITSFTFWEDLTTHHGLSPKLAEQAMARALTALLEAPPGAAAKTR
jgi:TetR/AcrR family transcriptional regulator, regulator of autoinduction and epiphytic fitness